ncbi:MAG: CHAD domain-containing protein, partial [Thiohalobacterales bacterium]|nr:CHAD domain-containing protein [Thiohalobacterales bacterium]
LHDFRVAIRRTRSALGQIKGVLPSPVLNRFKREFAWLGQMTGNTRDLDVYLLSFDNYRQSLPESMQDDIEPLRDFLRRHWEIEHKALVRALDSARYRRLVSGWRCFLETPVKERSTLPNARRPVYEVACRRIWRVYRRILKEGGAIDADSPAEALHELRKTAKKLRYLMEFFQSLFPARKIKRLIGTLKNLQNNLGDFQDFEVQVQTLKRFSEQMVAEDEIPARTLLAMGMLIEGLEQRQHQARLEFAARFNSFALPDNQARFRALFAPRARQGAA